MKKFFAVPAMVAFGLLVVCGILGITTQARADFQIVTVPQSGEGYSLFLDTAVKNVTTFTATAAGYAVTGTTPTAQLVDVASGNATIKPANTDVNWNDVIFTPTLDTVFNDFNFRGQVDTANTTLEVVVNDSSGNIFHFTIDKANQNFAAIGIGPTTNSTETIKSVEIQNQTGNFLQLKQIDFSLASGVQPIPEPSTLPLLLVGLALLGGGLFYRNRKLKV